MAAIIASNSQEWIASQLSATAADGRPSRTAWNYVRDCNGMMVIEPTVGFYLNPPHNAKCRWSTDHGTREPQLCTSGSQFPSQFPSRHLVLWNDERLESEAARIREKYWNEMKALVAPQRFEDLYEYFDSMTLFMSGAVNLWNLINLLASDACHNWREVEKQVANECNKWVLEWLEVLPGAASNRESLIKWDMKSDILTAVTCQFDWDNDLKALDLVGQNFLRESFLHHFERLTGNKPDVARFNTHAAEDRPMSARNPVKPAARTTAEASSSPNDAPTPSSSVQALSTIPEESASIKSAVKPEGLTIDTDLAPHIPLQTVSAPSTAVPRIEVDPQPAKEAEDAPVTNGRKDKVEDEFLSNQDLADRFQTTARQLSSQSMPGERQDSMLHPSPNNIPPRAVSATEKAGVSQHAQQLQHTFPEKAGTIPRNMYGNKPPFRGPPKSPRGYGQTRQQPPANMIAFSSDRPLPQQRASIGSSQQQQMMQPFVPPNNGMHPPPPGFVPSSSHQGVPSNSDGFPPTAQGFQMGVGMEPMLAPPGVDFQNQMQMPPLNMGQPQLSHPQAIPVSAPPQYMGQQNVGTPVYQPNGYIPQSQKQAGRDKGNKKGRHDDRRDSLNSNGSRSKIRDDPIHGPVYALRSSKDSNTPSGRRLSNQDGCLTADPKKPGSHANTECRNHRYGEKLMNPPRDFVDCPCFRCVRSSRSLFVRHDKVSVERAQTTLMNYMGGWGAVQVVVAYEGAGSLVVFNSDHDAIRAMQDLCARPNKGRDIPGLGRVTHIWYAWFSKHYTEAQSNPDGLPRGLWEAKGLRRRSSSTLSRDSNPYRNQLPNNTLFNTANFVNYGPGIQPSPVWTGETGGSFNLNMVPVYQQPTQRTLWNPNSVDQNRKPRNTEPKTKNGFEYQPKTYPKRPDGITALKEDWRSKPPAEEVIEDISSDDGAPADISSNSSSQGARGIKICLPNETGSSRSRSISPDAKEVPSDKQVRECSPESLERAIQEGKQVQRGADYDSKAEPVAKETVPVSSGYRKGTAELAVPVEEFQPNIIAEQVQPTEKNSTGGFTSYSKVTSELTGATESFDTNTVIRYKPPRSPLPKEWLATTEQEPSGLQDRLGALRGALQLEALGKQVEGVAAEGTSDAAVPECPKAEEAPTEKPRVKKNWHKGRKPSRTKSKASNGTSASTSSSATPTETQSRGASRASNNRPESTADVTTQSPPHSQPMAKKNTKSQRKRKQPSSAETSATPAGQAKTAGSDEAQTVSIKESPTKKPKMRDSEPATDVQGQSAVEPVEPVDGTQNKPSVDKSDDLKDFSSQIDAGGPVRVEMDRSPQKPPQKSDCSNEQGSPLKQAPTDMQVVFEVPAGKDHSNFSPGANLFPNQKFTIDKVKRDSAMATPKESDARRRQPSAMHFPTKDARIALPLLPPNSKPFGSARGPRSKSDDPFMTVKNGPQPEDWLRDKAVKTPQKASSDPSSRQTSPTPSPEKKVDREGGRSRLNAAAKSFEPSSIPSSPAASVVSVLPTTAILVHKKPSLPGQKGPIEQRFVTPAEQVIDPSTVTQPGPPTKENKRVGPAPDRSADGGQKERSKSSGAAQVAPTATKKTAAEVASVVSIARKLVNDEEFPTLAAAATVPQRRASWAVKASAPAADAVGSKIVTAASPKATAAPKPPVTSPSNVKLAQRGDAVAQQAADRQGVGAGEKAKAGEDQWTTVGSGKKTGGKKNTNGNNSRSTPGKSRGGATGQGTRGGKVPFGEERKGG